MSAENPSSSDPSAPPVDSKCAAVLQKASAKVGGKPVLYATQYARPEGKVKGTSTGALARATFDAALKSMSKTLASGLPNDGWLIVTDEGLGIFGRVPITEGIGGHKGTIPAQLINSVAVQHGKKGGKADITISFVDDSEAFLATKTRATYPALSPWVQGRAVTATAAADAVAEQPVFDTQALYRDNAGLNH